MKKSLKIRGYGYCLRPVTVDDAQFIINVRLEDENRNKFIHKISHDINAQITWINNYLVKEDDYYFVVENLLTGEAEGLIGIYNINGKSAEWGRWVIKKGSM